MKDEVKRKDERGAPVGGSVFFALCCWWLLFAFFARRIREPSATELHNLVCSNPSLKGPGMRRR